MGILLRDATIGACERLVTTLRTHLADRLTDAADAGLYLPEIGRAHV